MRLLKYKTLSFSKVYAATEQGFLEMEGLNLQVESTGLLIALAKTPLDVIDYA